jgi:phosphinothricin acetyltransferase
MRPKITPMQRSDWEAVRHIYEEGIATGHATFETEVPGWETWNASHLRECRLVAREEGRIVGWGALSPGSSRCVYGGVAEVSVYVATGAAGKGIGRALLRDLVAESERHGIWTLQAGVFPENVASLALHRACGFREMCVRERLGKLAGVWRDVVIFEKRSRIVGV